MNYTVVLPSIYDPYTNACYISMSSDMQEHTVMVDNTVDNRWVAASWNLGIEAMLEEDSDWLILLSAAIRFGKYGGQDFIKQLDNMQEHTVIEANKVFGWHLIAFSRDCITKVGRFDENFGYGFEDIDYSLRIQKAYNIEGRQRQLWDKVEVDCTDMGMAHGIKLAGINDPAEPRIEYFTRKWGRHPGAYQEDSYEHPFNDPTLSIKDWPKP